MSTDDNSAIGAAEMRELNQEFSREEICELVLIFSDEAPRLLGQMDAALERHDGEALGRAAHALRGAGLNFGAHFLNELCQHVETLAQAKDCAGASTLFLQVRQELARVQTALRKECDNPHYE